MRFQIHALPLEPFTPLFAMSDTELAERLAVRVTADDRPVYPCRVSLVDAAPGERLILLHYQHQGADTPYRASHAIYVREAAETAAPAPGEVPEMLRRRMLSLRAFSEKGMLVAADLVDGKQLEPAVEALLANPKAAYLHAHFALPGCYAARIDRA